LICSKGHRATPNNSINYSSAVADTYYPIRFSKTQITRSPCPVRGNLSVEKISAGFFAP
jgi:hypothetical protein